jgi:hypothetical protein
MGIGTARPLAVVIGAIVAVAAALAIPAAASAATVDCSGKVTAAEGSNGKAYDYSFLCGSPQGDATQVDAYSIISNKDVAGFSTEVLVSDTNGQALNDESFGCEGPIPSDGFGCNGKASLYHTITSGFSLIRNPCSNRSQEKGAWHVWVVASANKINPTTGAKTPAVSEPLRLRVPSCGDQSPAKDGKGSNHGRS